MKKFEYEKLKNENEDYLFHLQKFLDIAENIEDDSLRMRLTSEMLKCEDAIGKMLENME